jgi:hypothetical protein
MKKNFDFIFTVLRSQDAFSKESTRTPCMLLGSFFYQLIPILTDVQLGNDSAIFSTHAKADVIIDRLQSALNTIKRYYSTIYMED